MSRGRGQAGLEFLALTFFILLLFSLVTMSYNYNRTRYLQRDIELEMRNVERDIAYAIASATLEGDGFSTVINLPSLIGGMNYTADISGSHIFVKLNNSEFAHSTILLTSNVTGSLSYGENTVSNKGGEIFIG